jgi:hypothetical protein
LRTVIESYISVTGATYAARAGDRLIGVNRAGVVTVTLPTAQLRAGRVYTVKDESGAAATNNITVATEGSETIDGSPTNVISDDYGAKHYYSNGSNWFQVPLLPGASVAHSATTGQGTDDHHAQAHSLASHSTEAHSELTGVGTDDHHAEAHTAAHASGGGDALKIDDLSGADDNTDLDFSTSAHGLVPKGTNVGDFLKDDGTWATPAGGSGAVTREGGQTTEATTTSTTAVDLLSATSLTIAAISPFIFIYNGRKTTGAAADAACGLKLNTTVTAEAISTAIHGYRGTNGNTAEAGGYKALITPRVTNYLHGALVNYSNSYTADNTHQTAHDGAGLTTEADFITAQSTSVILRGDTASASVTLGVDELQVYEYATS